MPKDLVQQPAASGPAELADLAQRINNSHLAAIQAAGAAIEHAIDCGLALLEAKAAVGHGNWLPWLNDNTTVSHRTAQRWMRFAENADALREIRHAVADLTFAEADRLLAAPPKVGDDTNRREREHEWPQEGLDCIAAGRRPEKHEVLYELIRRSLIGRWVEFGKRMADNPGWAADLRADGVPDWYIDRCRRLWAMNPDERQAAFSRWVVSPEYWNDVVGTLQPASPCPDRSGRHPA